MTFGVRNPWPLIGFSGLGLFVLAGLVWLAGLPRGRTVAITVDDLPYVHGGFSYPDLTAEIAAADAVNSRLLGAFRAHGVPVTGFVIQQGVEHFGQAGTQILRQWISQGLDLGNHTYSHSPMRYLSIEAFEDEVVRGESGFAPLLREVGKKPKFFRFPYNETGETKAKHDAIAAFLSQRGYQVAVCTINNSDPIFNEAYLKLLEKGDDANAQKLRGEYLDYTSAEIDYFAALNKRVLGYEPPEVMLMHDNQLNADVIDQILALFERKQYKFVALKAAESERAYHTPDTYITKTGPMWGYRWAQERGVKVNGKLEPKPPQWIIDYGRQPPPPARVQ